MDKQLFSISDISDELVQYTDMYMKRVIINAKCHYYCEKSKMQKHGIIFSDLETFAETQRSILIQNVVLNITLKQIAYDVKISERMVRKHKHNVIESIRKRMKREYE